MRPGRRVVDANGVRHAVPVQLHQVAIDVAVEIVGTKAPLDARLERMGTRDVRHGCGQDVANRIHAVGGCDASVVVRQQDQVVLADLGVPIGRAAFLPDPRLVLGGVVLRIDRVAAFEEQTVRHRRRPLCLARVVARVLRVAATGGRLRVGERTHLVPFELRVPIVVHGELVLRADLPGHAHHLVLNPLVLDAGPSVLVEVVRDDRIGRDASPGGEEPQLVPLDRSAQRHIEVRDEVDLAPLRQAPRAQCIGHVVALPGSVGPAEEQRSAETIAAFFRNHVDAHAATRDIGAHATGLVAHLGVRGVTEIGLHLAVRHQAVERHAIDLHTHIGLTRPMHSHVDLLHLLVAADVRVGHLHAWHERGLARVVARRGERVEHVAGEHGCLLRALDVHDRGRARHGHGLLERAHAQLDVHGGREVRRQLQGVALRGIETGQHERQ